MIISKFCKLHGGKSKYDKKYILSNPGAYPVYSSQTKNDGVIGYISTAEFINKTGITWTTRGVYAGTVFLKNNTTFSITGNCGFIEIFPSHHNQVLIEYLFYWLAFNLKAHAVGEQNKRLSSDVLGKLDIPNVGNIQKQIEFINKYKSIYDSILKTKEISMFIESINIDHLESKSNLTELSFLVDDLIDEPMPTNNSFFTKTFINANQGNIPVYGASEFEDPSYGYVADNLPKVRYYQDCFTWNIDGSIGIFYRKGKFTISEKVIPFQLKKIYLGKILPEYLVIKIREVSKLQGFSRSNKFGGNKLKSVHINVMDFNLYPISKQQEIVDKYNEISTLKEKIASELSELI